MKYKTLCNCLCFCCCCCCDSASLIWNIRESGAKTFFTGHGTANTIELFVSIKTGFCWSILFQNKSQRRGISWRLLDKYSHLFICMSLKYTLNSEQKLVYTVKIILSEHITFTAVLYFEQVFVFCRLINKSVWEWSLLIMCK